ncbi:MAG: ABC transporter ATP-binding protein [Alphaproteobacteria bacterium]
MLFEVEDLIVNYGKVPAVKGISLKLAAGQIITLIGANGAGKSTTLRSISGLVKAAAGDIRFDGHSIANMAPEKIVGLGIAHVPEGRRIFPSLSVLENLQTGAFLRRDKRKVAEDLQAVFGYFPRLQERQSQKGKTLSGGEQQMLAIGRALMSDPKLLLLDEPSLGLSPVMMQEIGRIVQEINSRGVPVILVEQNAEMALRLANYGYVLETGRVTLEGETAMLRAHDHVRAAYLGG